MRAKEGGTKMVCFRLGDGKWELWHICTKEGGKHCSTSILRGGRGGGKSIVGYVIDSPELGGCEKNVVGDNPNSVESHELLEV